MGGIESGSLWPANQAAPAPVQNDSVALLCDEKNFDAAIRLEQLWNELAQKHSFALRCAYSTDTFVYNVGGPDFLNRICAEHSHVLSS